MVGVKDSQVFVVPLKQGTTVIYKHLDLWFGSPTKQSQGWRGSRGFIKYQSPLLLDRRRKGKKRVVHQEWGLQTKSHVSEQNKNTKFTLINENNVSFEKKTRDNGRPTPSPSNFGTGVRDSIQTQDLYLIPLPMEYQLVSFKKR